MKLLVAGCGHLGSEVAMQSLIWLKPSLLMLYDIKPLSGDILDLRHACKGLGLKTRIITSIGPADYIIITAGKPRRESDKDFGFGLFLHNERIMKDVIIRLRKAFKHGTTVIVLTNPVMEMTNRVRFMLAGYYKVEDPESILLEMRGGKDCGLEIVRSKGYSSFGPAVSCVKLIQRLEKGKA